MKQISPNPQKKKEGLKDIIICVLFFIPVLAAFTGLARSIKSINWLFYILLLFSGWLTWTFIEYMAHRFWMHHPTKKPGNTVYHMHMHHHAHPDDIRIKNGTRITLLVLNLLVLSIAAWFNNYFTLFAGLFSGFVWYTFIHVILHKRWAAKIFPKLQEFHIHHHCKYPDKCFSFSNTWWDQVFGTLPPRDVKISERIRTFYFTGHL